MSATTTQEQLLAAAVRYGEEALAYDAAEAAYTAALAVTHAGGTQPLSAAMQTLDAARDAVMARQRERHQAMRNLCLLAKRFSRQQKGMLLCP